MSSLLIFAGALAAMLLMAVIINKISGAKAHYMDQLVLMPGEIKITEDREADFHVVTSLGKAAYMSFARPRRTHVVLTDCRMVIASKVLFGGRYMITHMLYFTRDKAPAVELDKVSGGLYSRGYLIMQTDRSTMTAEMWKLVVARMQGVISRNGLRPLSPEESTVVLDYLRRNSG